MQEGLMLCHRRRRASACRRQGRARKPHAFSRALAETGPIDNRHSDGRPEHRRIARRVRERPCAAGLVTIPLLRLFRCALLARARPSRWPCAPTYYSMVACACLAMVALPSRRAQHWQGHSGQRAFSPHHVARGLPWSRFVAWICRSSFQQRTTRFGFFRACRNIINRDLSSCKTIIACRLMLSATPHHVHKLR